MKLTVSETAKRSGVSVRTLHYYDEIGLLAPTETTEAGYRYYDDSALARLQEILFFRELEFPLKDIADILSRPEYDRREVLLRHRSLLELKKRRLEDLIALVDATTKGVKMKKKPITEAEIAQQKDAYAREAAERWGKTEAYAESKKRHDAYTEAQKNAIAQEMSALHDDFAAARDTDPAGEAAQALVQRLQEHISKWHYTCTRQILAGLGQMYVDDQRFTENIDRHGDGTAQFMSEAIEVYCK